jgi:CHAT domain-containing protein
MRNSKDDILYRELPYMMNEFRISYAYYAKVLAESVKKMTVSMSNSLIAFAPVYTRPINIDSVLQTRQARLSGINDLPFARQEAEYVSELTEGTLCINDGATEMRFKAEAYNYDIIHLAMHTVLNDQFPMHQNAVLPGGGLC